MPCSCRASRVQTATRRPKATAAAGSCRGGFVLRPCCVALVQSAKFTHGREPPTAAPSSPAGVQLARPAVVLLGRCPCPPRAAARPAPVVAANAAPPGAGRAAAAWHTSLHYLCTIANGPASVCNSANAQSRPLQASALQRCKFRCTFALHFTFFPPSQCPQFAVYSVGSISRWET